MSQINVKPLSEQQAVHREISQILQEALPIFEQARKLYERLHNATHTGMQECPGITYDREVGQIEHHLNAVGDLRRAIESWDRQNVQAQLAMHTKIQSENYQRLIEEINAATAQLDRLRSPEKRLDQQRKLDRLLATRDTIQTYLHNLTIALTK